MRKLRPVLIVVFLLVVIGAAYYLSLGPVSPSLETGETDTVTSTEEAGADDVSSFVEGTDDSGIVAIDTASALKERVLGDPSAPIKISEHSSFTCGHCGKFHKETFETFKAEYLDTGKAHLVFSDFPLNAPALHASILARCIDEDRYFTFVQELFEAQEDWAYNQEYLSYLKSKAAEYGLNENGFKACINNEDIRNGILNKMRAVQQQWDINSTPSFVVNNKAVISGAMPFDAFSAEIEKAVAPVTETAAETVEEPVAQTTDEPTDETVGDVVEEAVEDVAESVNDKAEDVKEEATEAVQESLTPAPAPALQDTETEENPG